jgi:hypothetical protein
MRKLTRKHILFSFALILIINLSSHAQAEGTIKVEASHSVKTLIAKKRAYNKSLKYVEGFKIQLFYGSEQGAIKVKEDFDSVFPRVNSELKFHSPDWKVWIGSYKTRLKADRALVEIKEGFPSAIIRPAKVKI